MREALAEIVRARYGNRAITSANLIEPTTDQVYNYERHHGLLSLWIDIESSPHLIIIDTGEFKHMKHTWIGARQRTAFRLVMSAGIQPVAVDRLRTHTYAQRLEGLELKIAYPNYLGSHRHVRYIEDLNPLW